MEYSAACFWLLSLPAKVFKLKWGVPDETCSLRLAVVCRLNGLSKVYCLDPKMERRSCFESVVHGIRSQKEAVFRSPSVERSGSTLFEPLAVTPNHLQEASTAEVWIRGAENPTALSLLGDLSAHPAHPRVRGPLSPFSRTSVTRRSRIPIKRLGKPKKQLFFSQSVCPSPLRLQSLLSQCDRETQRVPHAGPAFRTRVWWRRWSWCSSCRGAAKSSGRTGR